MSGHIALHRKVLENPVVCKDADHLAIWIYLLCKAVWKPTDVIFHGERITLSPGQLTTGRKAIAENLRISESKVQRVLKLFESEQQIEQRTDRQCRLITIVSWDKYQFSEQRVEQQVNNDRTTSEQRVNTKEEYKNINKSNKNNNTNTFNQEFEKLWEMYPKKQGKKRALESYVSARKKGATYEEVDKGIAAYITYIGANGIEDQYIKQGSTFFSQQAWQDDWTTRRENGTTRHADTSRGYQSRGGMARPVERSPEDYLNFTVSVPGMAQRKKAEERSEDDA